jgi:hypothetical protein
MNRFGIERVSIEDQGAAELRLEAANTHLRLTRRSNFLRLTRIKVTACLSYHLRRLLRMEFHKTNEGILVMKTKKKSPSPIFTPAEERAARSERIEVNEAEPYGWMARSESGTEQDYHLFSEPRTKQLACTCADFVFRGNAEPGYECKHVSAVLKYIGRRYLVEDYDPQHQRPQAA